MTPPKLSDSQKHELVMLYRQGGHTMATLGQRFGVSTSTVGRILKLAAAETGEDTTAAAPVATGGAAEAAPEAIASVPVPVRSAPPVRDPQPPQVDPSIEAQGFTRGARESHHSRTHAPHTAGTAETGSRRVRRRSSSGSSGESLPLFAPGEGGNALELIPIAPNLSDSWDTDSAIAPSNPIAPDSQGGEDDVSGATDLADLGVSPRSRVDRPIKKRLDDDAPSATELPTETKETRPKRRSASRSQAEPVAVEDSDDLTGDLELDDDLDLDEDDFEFGDDDGESGIAAVFGRGANPNQPIEIMPLEVSRIPNPCYLVIDRAAELVARPLEDFRELGQISPQDAASKTLPVFDNHRVARRFSARNQRIIKVPDANDLFQKTGPYLQAKGITHLLIDGQVYLL